jgi:hypothetical protein
MHMTLGQSFSAISAAGAAWLMVRAGTVKNMLVVRTPRRKREVIANQQWKTVQEEDQQNQELLQLSRQILDLTKAVHVYAAARSSADAK